MDTSSIIAVAGGTTIVLAALAGAGRLVLGGFRMSRIAADVHDLVMLHLRPAGDRGDQREGMLDRVLRTEETVARELHPNGSNSMHDRVRVVEAFVQEVRAEREASRHGEQPTISSQGATI